MKKTTILILILLVLLGFLFVSSLNLNKPTNIEKKKIDKDYHSTFSVLEKVSELNGVDLISSGKGIQKLVVRGLSGMRVVTFLNGAKIAYESIITSFSKGDLKSIKNLLAKNVYDQFDEAIKDQKARNVTSETTFIGISSAEIKEHNQNKNMLEVTVEFVSEIISCVKDKDNKIVSGNPEKIKKVLDTWKFSKDSRSSNPNWLLIDTQA